MAENAAGVTASMTEGRSRRTLCADVARLHTVPAGSAPGSEAVALSPASSAAATASDLLLLNDGLLGVSTGYMTRLRGRWPELVAEARNFSEDAIELSALSADELPALMTFLTSELETFRNISVHGPARGWSGSADALAAELAEAVPDYVRGVVMHPETLDDPAAFRILRDRLFLENMDTHKPDGRTVQELAPYFTALPEAGFCFDVAHAYLNDPSMTLAHGLLDAFGERLREVHVSSILDDGTHVPLNTDDARLFWPVLERCVGVPWILEAEPPHA